MAAERFFLSLDQGGHSSRALVFDSQGDVVSRAQCEVAVVTADDRVEQSPLEIVTSLVRVANDAIANLPTEKRLNLQSAALVCQRSSIAFWRADDGAPVAPILSWQDRRGAALLQDVLNRSLAADQIKKISGLVASPHYGASKLAWMLRHDSDVQAAVATGNLRCGPLSAFLIRALGTNAIDVVDGANACRTQLMSLATLDWDESALGAFAIPRNLLPRIVPTCSDFGMLKLNDISLPLKYVNGDQNAALFANGMVDPHAIYVSIGTGAFCLAPWNSAELPPRQLLTTLVAHSQGPLYAVEGTVNAAASALDWLQHQLNTSHTHQTIARWLAETDTTMIFINAINGLASPFWTSNVEPRFVSDEGSVPGDAERFLAVIESIVFALCLNIQLMQRSGTSARRIFMAGGLGLYDGICQRMANLSGMPVIRSEDAEASARGAAFWLAGCPSQWAVGLQRISFQPQADAALQMRYERWQRAMQDYMRPDQNPAGG